MKSMFLTIFALLMMALLPSVVEAQCTIDQFVVQPNPLPWGTQATASWQTTGCVDVKAFGGQDAGMDWATPRTKSLSGSQVLSVPTRAGITILEIQAIAASTPQNPNPVAVVRRVYLDVLPASGGNVPAVTFMVNPATVTVGGTVTYTWSATNGATACTIQNSTLPGMPTTIGTSGAVTYTVTQTGTFSGQLVCSNQWGNSNPMTATLVVNPTGGGNNNPVCRISGENPRYHETDHFPALVFALAEGSDPDGDSVTYEWSFVSGSPGSEIQNANTYNGGAHFQVQQEGTYTFRCIVRDGKGGVSAPADLVLIFNKKVGPVCTAPSLLPVTVDGPWVVLNWSGVSGAQDYYVEIAQNPGFNPILSKFSTYTNGANTWRFDPDVSGRYWYRVFMKTSTGWCSSANVGEINSGTATSSEENETLPEAYMLDQNYPNPFNPTTTIPYSLPEAGDVQIVVYDAIGREVAVLVDGYLPAGSHQVVLSANDWPSGRYFVRMETSGDVVQTRMMVLGK